jgi:hypothetical protein
LISRGHAYHFLSKSLPDDGKLRIPGQSASYGDYTHRTRPVTSQYAALNQQIMLFFRPDSDLYVGVMPRAELPRSLWQQRRDAAAGVLPMSV